MRKIIWAGGVALLAVATPTYAQDQEEPQSFPEGSPLDSPVTPDAPVSEFAPPPPTGDPVLDRFNALEARVRQLEARNAQLESQAADTQTRVENVEVRAAKGVQATGAAPTFADVSDTFTFKPRGTIQADYAAYNERAGGYDYSNGTDIRRARFGFDGTFLRSFRYRIEAEYVKNTVNLLDAYIQYIVNPRVLVTFGQHKAPYGLEANTSDALNSVIERGMFTNAFGAVGAERRVGVSATYAGDHLNAQAGVFGAGEGVQRNAATPDEGYGVNGRVTWDPLIDNDAGRIVHLGASAFYATNFAGNTLTIGDRPNTRVDGGNIISVAIPAGTVAAPTGPRNARYFGAEAAAVFGPFSVQGEYGNLNLDRLGVLDDLGFDGLYVFGSWFLTGESRRFSGGNADRIRPLRNFDPKSGGLGALELLTRYDRLDLSDRDLSTLKRRAETWTAGLNWYLNPNLRAVFNYIRFKGTNSPLVVAPAAVNGTTAKGEAFATRLQVDF
jgi:phosphate-selective porin OprO/OprP